MAGPHPLHRKVCPDTLDNDLDLIGHDVIAAEFCFQAVWRRHDHRVQLLHAVIKTGADPSAKKSGKVIVGSSFAASVGGISSARVANSRVGHLVSAVLSPDPRDDCENQQLRTSINRPVAFHKMNGGSAHAECAKKIVLSMHKSPALAADLLGFTCGSVQRNPPERVHQH